jgi:hypothetical protein
MGGLDAAVATTPVICPAGQYCPERTETPIDCPKGTFNPRLGMRSENDCEVCPAGYYCDVEPMTQDPTLIGNLCAAG